MDPPSTIQPLYSILMTNTIHATMVKRYVFTIMDLNLATMYSKLLETNLMQKIVVGVTSAQATITILMVVSVDRIGSLA